MNFFFLTKDMQQWEMYRPWRFRIGTQHSFEQVLDLLNRATRESPSFVIKMHEILKVLYRALNKCLLILLLPPILLLLLLLSQSMKYGTEVNDPLLS